MSKNKIIQQSAFFALQPFKHKGLRISRFKPFCYLAYTSTVLLVLFVIFAIFPVAEIRENVTAIIDPDTYSLSIKTNDSLALTLVPSASGAIKTIKDTITVTAHSPSGYQLWMSNGTNSSDLALKGDTSGEMDKTIYGASGTFAAPATLSLSNSVKGTWGFAVPGLTGFDSAASYNPNDPSVTAKYAKMPVIGEEIMVREMGSATPESGDNTDIYYGVLANYGIVSGSYETTISYYTVTQLTDQANGEINITPNELEVGYEATTATIETSLATTRHLGNVTATIGGRSCSDVTISKQNPLTFTCTVPADLAAGSYDVAVQTGIGANFFLNDGVVVKSDPFGAAFEAAGKSKQGNYYKMQDMGPEICNAVPTPTTTTEDISTQLIDTRDSKVYWVNKLLDGNCWMSQNLDFAISTSGTSLTTANSDVLSDKTITAANGWTDRDISFYEGNDKYLPNGNGSATDITCNSTTNGGENCHYHIGNYYNWTAATAGSGTSSVVSADAPESICPKGWRLPTSNSYTENYSFGKLTNAYGITNSTSGSSDADLIKSPLWFVRAGDINDGGVLNNQGSVGFVWPSRAHESAFYSYSFRFSSSSVNPSNSLGRSYGSSVRCVAQGYQYKIEYNANEGTNAPAPTVVKKQTPSSTAVSIDVATIPTRSGYEFKGYATSASAATPNYTYSNGSFSPATVTIAEPGTTTLYAVWEKALFGGITTMQEMTPEICAAEPTPAAGVTTVPTKQLQDTRDGKLYWVSKLADGNCWMTQNLDLDLNSTTLPLTSATSDVSVNWSPTTDTSTTVFNSLDNTAQNSYDGGNYYWDGQWDGGWNNRSGYSDFSRFSTDSNIAGPNGTHYHVGNLYQWNAATAGTGGTIVDTEATSSVCPKGWRLPYSKDDTADKSFGKLLAVYSATSDLDKNTASPLFFIPAGRIQSGSLYGAGDSGPYWSSTAYSDVSFAFSFTISSDNYIFPSIYYYRYGGFSVRCVAR